MTATSSPTMETFRDRLGEIADVSSAIALLSWDQQTYMPKKAGPGRGQQLATLSSIAHRMFTAPDFGDMLRRLRDRAEGLSQDEASLVHETMRDYDLATKLPDSFVKESAMAENAAFIAWEESKKSSDFPKFRPHLEKLVALQQQKADLLGYEGSPYNALHDQFERGMTAERLRPIFGALAKRQQALVARIAASPSQPQTAWLDQDWDVQKQWDFGMRVLADMGYDMNAGRQDKSSHPFTTNFDIYDVRVTTRLIARDLFSALSSTIHEGGHALFEQGFRHEDRRTTLAASPSLGLHESQSRMWENMIGRSLPFWRHYYPILREHFPAQLANVPLEQVYRANNWVRPSLIRVEADECTYNLHIIVRFEIEIDLLEGKMKVADLPEVWNAKYKQYLGVDVPDHARGCMQDVHWSGMSFGYFPTYSLGNLYAAQMFEKILIDIPGLWAEIEAGNMRPLLDWLRKNVHTHGRRKTAPQIVRDITGKDPDSEAYLRYLETKYATIYSLS